MHRWRRFAPGLLALTGSACIFDASGLGETGGTSGASATTTGESTGTTTSTTMSTDPTLTGTDTVGTATTGPSTSTTASTTATTATTAPTTTLTTSDTTDPTTTGGPSCGDGSIDAGEECDNGPLNSDDAVCKANCTNNVCGDGALGPGEGCDDGNAVDLDGCSAACVLETCGDKIVDPGEECDDGNLTDDDECTNACKDPACGDGITQKSNSEGCDDGIDNGASKPCTPDCLVNVCGDGYALDPGEACDDGNTEENDACTNACALAVCGDGIVEDGVEECDDGNNDDSDGCTNTCMTNGKRIFVTSGTFTGSLGGLNGAHSKCNAAATAAALGGTWKAWIASGPLTGPVDTMNKSSKPYIRIDGVVVADNFGDLISGSIHNPINVDENGATPGGSQDVWTNVAEDGTPYDILSHCGDWFTEAGNARIGLRTAMNAAWTSSSDKGCGGGKRLYCVEQ